MTSQQPPDALQIGQIFEGKYKILRELGRGGFGMVYLAYQEPMDRYVALKVLRPGIGLTAPSAKERFLREVKIISKLKHPNTVTIHEFGETADGGLYMTLEYVEGETLKDAFKRDGAFNGQKAAELARQIAKSLAEAHRHGIVHRDLKPQNIMLTSIEGDKDFVKVLDFGVARLLDPKTTDLTSVGLPEGERELIGTPRYMSPEQVRGEGLSGASDIYSLGLILYEMLTGEQAVQGDSTMALITQQISPEPLRLPGLQHVDPLLQDITRIAVAKSLSDRWQSAEQMAEALEQYLFSTRSGRNTLTGASGEFMQSFQSQMMQAAPQSTGWQQAPANWSAQTPSGNWLESGYYDPNQMPQNMGSGQYPQPVRQTMPPSGYYPGQPPYPQGQQPQYPQGPQHPYPNMPPQNPHASGQYPQMPNQQMPNPHQSQLIQHNHQFAQNLPQPGSGQYELGRESSSNDMELKVERNADFEDFQATVEHSKLDRSQLRKSIAGSSFSDLPPPPVDERPFQEAPPEPEKPVDPPKPKPVASKAGEQSMVGFTFDLVKISVLTLAMLVVAYISFIVAGAALAPHTQDGLRLVAAAIMAAAPPFLALMTDPGSGERFKIITPITVRAMRVLGTSAVFSVGLLLVLSAIFATGIVGELRKDPNWFLSSNDTKLAGINREISYGAADLVAGSMSAIGLYDHRRGNVQQTPTPTRLPQPTRPKNGESASNDEPADTADTSGKPAKEAGSKSEKDPGYVTW